MIFFFSGWIGCKGLKLIVSYITNKLNTGHFFRLLILFGFFIVTSAIYASEEDGEIYDPGTVIQKNKASSERRILGEDPARDAKIISMTGNDSLTLRVLDEHSLILGSRIVIPGRRALYSWFVNHVEVSAAVSKAFGKKYRVTKGGRFQYHGEDGEGLVVDFYRAYNDSVSTILVGDGHVKVFFLTISGSFINYIEYGNVGGNSIFAQNCMYVRVNNAITRMFADFLFSISDIETGIMNKILSLDDTSLEAMDTFMTDRFLPDLLIHPDAEISNDIPKRDITLRDAIVKASSTKEAEALGRLIIDARKNFETNTKSIIKKAG